MKIDEFEYMSFLHALLVELNVKYLSTATIRAAQATTPTFHFEIHSDPRSAHDRQLSNQ